jgi:hypothetical protein
MLAAMNKEQQGRGMNAMPATAMPPPDVQCPACDGIEEHDQNCELRTLPIPLAAHLGLERALLEVKRRSK